MKKVILLFLCLCILLCGCESSFAETVPETVSNTEIEEYKDRACSIMGSKVPASFVNVYEKDGLFNLSVKILDSKKVDKFADYVFSVQDAFEQTFPVDCLGSYSVMLIGPDNIYRIYFSSSEYDTKTTDFSGIFTDSRSNESAIYKVTDKEMLINYFDPVISEVTEPKQEDVVEFVPSTTEKEEEELTNSGTTYILNTNTHKFHLSSCSSAKKTKASNKTSFTGTRDEVIAKGYDPCQNCNP